MPKFLQILALSLALSLPAAASDRVAVVVSDDLEPYQVLVDPFVSQFPDGVSVYQLHGRASEVEGVITRLKREDPGGVFAIGAKAAFTVKGGLPATPMVYASIIQPRRYGIEGGQITGVSTNVEPVAFLSEFTGFFPSVKRIGVLKGPQVSDARYDAMALGAQALNLQLVSATAQAPRQMRAAFHELADQGIDALWLPPDRMALTTDNYRMIVEECRRRRIPLLVDTENMVEAGAMFTIVPAADGVALQVSRMMQEILDGAAPSVIPAEDPEQLRVIINLRSIERAGIPIDPLLLDFADHVIR